MRIYRHENLQKWHSIAAIAQADTICVIEDEDEIIDVNQRDILLGAGSNIVFVGEIKTRIVHIAYKGLQWLESGEHVFVTAAAGESWQQLVAQTVARGVGGLQNLALIPGTVGAAAVQNIGAYGQEIAQVVDEISVYDRRKREKFTLKAKDCNFNYRNSIFKSRRAIDWMIVALRLKLQRHPDLRQTHADLHNNYNNIGEIYDAVCAIRKRKIPDPQKHPNAGSFFHNPIVSKQVFAQIKTRFPEIVSYPQANDSVKISAAWLIERAGLKGKRDGAVGIAAEHALILTNYGATGAQIVAFADVIRNKIKELFNIDLHVEPTIVSEEKNLYGS